MIDHGTMGRARCPVPVTGQWKELFDMSVIEFFVPGEYDSPLTASGRARTIAAFHLAQGDVDVLGKAEMRRDVLNVLMSPSAVSYWLGTQGWLEKTRKAGSVQLVRLTDKGLSTCANSVNGGSNVPTTPELVSRWRERMKQGAARYERKEFKPIDIGPAGPSS